MPQDVQAMSDLNALIGGLESGDVSARCGSAEKLAHLGEQARPAAVALVRALATEDEDLREWAVGALEGMGPPNVDDVSRLAELLNRSELEVAYWAATLLGRLDGQAASAVGQLTEALEGHAEMAVRERAAWALGQIGRDAAAAKAVLSLAAKSPNPRLAKLAKAAIERL
jgi:HEAT repeat protein